MKHRGASWIHLLTPVAALGIFLAVALWAFQDSRAAGRGAWLSLGLAALWGAFVLGAISGALLLLGFLAERYLSKFPTQGKRLKVPRGSLKGEWGIVECKPINTGLVQMRLESTGKPLLVAQELFENPAAFEDGTYAWLQEGVSVRAAHMPHGSRDIRVSMARVCTLTDTYAALVLPDGEREAIWLGPYFLRKP